MRVNGNLLSNATRLHGRLLSLRHHYIQNLSTTRTPSQTALIATTPTAETHNRPASTTAVNTVSKPQVAHSDLHTPSIAQYLGFGGTIPFLFGALATSVYPEADAIAQATQLCGAGILSYLGGIQWGVAITRPKLTASRQLTTDLTVSVLPPLAAWAAALAQPVTGLPVLTGSLATVFAYDRWRFAGRVGGGASGRGNHVPHWFLRLRAPLTLAAAGGTAVSWLAVRRAGLADACAGAQGVLTEPPAREGQAALLGEGQNG